MKAQWQWAPNACRTRVANAAVHCCWGRFLRAHPCPPDGTCIHECCSSVICKCWNRHKGINLKQNQVAIFFTSSSAKSLVKEEINFDYSLTFTLAISLWETVWLGMLESLTTAWLSTVPANHLAIKLKTWGFSEALSLQWHEKKCG